MEILIEKMGGEYDEIPWNLTVDDDSDDDDIHRDGYVDGI
jgi:hypothetical protein